MDTNITINDGTTSRVYASSMGGVRQIKPNQAEHLRQVAEFGVEPKTLLARVTRDGNTVRTSVSLKKVEVNATTGRRGVAVTTLSHSVDQELFTLAQSEAQIAEMATLAAAAGFKTDMSLGAI